MADDAKEDKQDKKPEAKAEAGAQTDKGASAKGGGMILWLILTIVILVGGGGGFAFSLFLGSSGPADPNAVEAKPVAHKPEKAAKAGGHGGGEAKAPKAGGHGGGEEKAGPVHDPDKPWMYDKLDPMVANLDEPGVTRYVRVSIILEISPKLDFIEGEVFLEEKKSLLQDWMTTYLAGLSLEDVRGSRNLNRIKQDVLEQFNKLLFDADKPYVEKVLFKEFAVQ